MSMDPSTPTPGEAPGTDPEALLRKAVAVLHDLNNPLAFLLANQAVEEEHAQALINMVAELHKLDDPAVNGVLDRFTAQARISEMQEILVDNNEGLQRLHQISRGLRDTLLGPPKTPTRSQGRTLSSR